MYHVLKKSMYYSSFIIHGGPTFFIVDNTPISYNLFIQAIYKIINLLFLRFKLKVAHNYFDINSNQNINVNILFGSFFDCR